MDDIIELENLNQLKEKCIGYCSCDSHLKAIAEYKAKYKIEPRVVYKYINPVFKWTTYFIPFLDKNS